jgi:hypothetical protein
MGATDSFRGILMSTDLIIALLPIAALFVGFLVFRLTAFKTSLYAWTLELAAVLVYYRQPQSRSSVMQIYRKLSSSQDLGASTSQNSKMLTRSADRISQKSRRLLEGRIRLMTDYGTLGSS